MFAPTHLSRLGRLSMLLALASVTALTQGCAAEEAEDSSEADVGVDAITTSQAAPIV